MVAEMGWRMVNFPTINIPPPILFAQHCHVVLWKQFFSSKDLRKNQYSDLRHVVTLVCNVFVL